MNLRAGFVLAASVALAAAVPASAEARADEVRVTFANGRVTVIAQNATLLEILQEWSRVGGSRFVEAEKVPSPERLTLRLENVTEIRALEVLLRPAAGYFAAPARTPGLSSIGIVLIKPVSAAPVMAQGQGDFPQPIPDAPERLTAAPPRPDDDGPTMRQTPPPYPMPNPQAQQGVPNAPAPIQSTPGSPMGQSSPLSGTTTQAVPGLGAVTSSQPGAIIPNAPRTNGRPASLTPSQPVPRPGGGG